MRLGWRDEPVDAITVEDGLIYEWRTVPAPKCHDCHVEAGQPHIDGCDVARCKTCGFQRIARRAQFGLLGWSTDRQRWEAS